MPQDSNNNIQKTDVLIIGGGWAGLSAAIKLVEQGKTVCIIETAKQLGGRARKVQYKQYSVDNGTHIMIGAYSETLKLIKKIHNLNSPTYIESELLERQMLGLNYKQPNNKTISIPKIALPAPFNIIFSFLLASGLTLKEKLLILKLGLKIKLNLINLTADTPLESFLNNQNQTEPLIKKIWEPLCLAIMNTPINQCSSEIFLRVIEEAFFKSRQASNLLLFKKDLSETFATPAQKYIEQRQGKVSLNQKISSIKKEKSGYTITTQSNVFYGENIIIATAPIAAIKLLDSINANHHLDTLLNNLAAFSYQPICTVYIQYPESVKCERSMQGFLGTTAQWMFDKSSTNKAGFISIIISSQGTHTEWDNPSLTKNISHELSLLYPKWPQPIDAFVIREKRATFTASVNINRIRPSNKTNLDHIWLAGDYTNTQYPATLEGAVRSGLTCVEDILSSTK